MQPEVDWLDNPINWGGYGEATDAVGLAQWAATLYADQSLWEQSQRVGVYTSSRTSLPCEPSCMTGQGWPLAMLTPINWLQALTCYDSASAEMSGWHL